MGRGFGQYNIPTGLSFDFDVCNNKLTQFFFKTVGNKMGWSEDFPPKEVS